MSIRGADNIDSKFFIPIENELGLDYKKARGQLLALSLTKPDRYYSLRSELIDKITRSQVQDAYKLYWYILKKGMAPREDNGQLEQITYKNVAEETINFTSGVPEHLINAFASKCAKSIEEMAEECINMILPDDYLKLSQNRQKDILEATGRREA